MIQLNRSVKQVSKKVNNIKELKIMDNKLQKKLKNIEVKLRDNMRNFTTSQWEIPNWIPTWPNDHYLQIQLDFDRMEQVILEHPSELMMDLIKKNPKLTKIFDDLEDEYDEKIMDKFYSLYKEKNDV